MENEEKKVSVEPAHVIAALREQIAELSFSLAMQTARAVGAEARAEEVSR